MVTNDWCIRGYTFQRQVFLMVIRWLHCQSVIRSCTDTCILWACFRKASGKQVCEICTPSNPFHKAKLGHAGVDLFFLFLLQIIDCGYSLEPPRRGGSNVYPQSMFWSKNKKNSKYLLLIFFHFFATLKISVYCMGMFS